MSKGKYIVIEGHDGTGKTTQRDLLIERLIEKGIEAIAIREPGETPIGLELRRIIKDGQLDRSALTNLLLFSADRNETWNQVIKPALNKGTWVVSDRNWFSTWVYQGSEGLDRAEIVRLSHDLLGEYCKPDLSVILCADASNRESRLSKRGKQEVDTFEMKNDDFQSKVHQGYYDLAKELSLPTVDTSDRTPKDILEEIWKNFEGKII